MRGILEYFDVPPLPLTLFSQCVRKLDPPPSYSLITGSECSCLNYLFIEIEIIIVGVCVVPENEKSKKENQREREKKSGKAK